MKARCAGVGEQVGDGEVDLVVERLQAGGRLGARVLRVRGGEGDGDDRRVGDALHADLHRLGRLERGAHAGEAAHEGADRVAAAARLELAQGDAGGLHRSRHERAQRAAVVVEREARPQHLALIPVAEGVERRAVHARRPFGGIGASRLFRGGRSARPPAPARAHVGRRSQATRRGDAEGGEALLELLRRLAVEGEHEDAGRVDAAVHELYDAAHQGLGLARAGGSQHPGGAPLVFDRGALGFVEPHRVRAGGCTPGRRRRERRLRVRRAWVRRVERLGRPGGRAEQSPDVLEVEQGGVADAEVAWSELLRSEGEAEAERRAPGHERVYEVQQHVAGLRCELVDGTLPVPEPGGRIAAEQGPARLAGVVGPRTPEGEADPGRGRRRSLRELAAAAHVEEHEAWLAGRRLVGGGGHRLAGRARVLRPAGHRR